MNTMDRRLRVSGVLIALGLLILFISLIPNHALAFVGFAMLGAPLLLAGVVWYLISLLRESTSEHGGNPAPRKWKPQN